VEFTFHPFLDFGKQFVRPAQPIARREWSSAFVNIEVVSCQGLELSAGEVAKIQLKCRRDTWATSELKCNGNINEKHTFALKSLDTPITLSLDSFESFGARQIHLVHNGQLQFGSRPTLTTCLLNSLHTASVSLVLSISIKIVQELSEPTAKSATIAPAQDQAEVPKKKIVSHVSPLIESRQPSEVEDNCTLVALVLVPYILGWYMANFLFSFIVTTAIGVLHYSSTLKKDRESYNEAVANAHFDELNPDRDHQDNEPVADVTLTNAEKVELLALLPLWMTKPDMEKAEWLNFFVELLWPYLRSVLQKSILFNINTGSDNMPSVTVEQCYLGSNPPTVTGIKCYDQAEHGSNVMLDLGVSFMEDVVIKVRIKLGPCEITVVLDQVFLEAVLRLELGPPVPQVPPFKGIKVAVVGDIKLDFSLTVAGFPVTSIPGVILRFVFNVVWYRSVFLHSLC